MVTRVHWQMAVSWTKSPLLFTRRKSRVFRFRIECHSDVSCQSSSYVDGAEKQQNRQDRCIEQLSESSRLSSCVFYALCTVHQASAESSKYSVQTSTSPCDCDVRDRYSSLCAVRLRVCTSGWSSRKVVVDKRER